jgi:SAM-dependent methyltransferase
MIENIKRWLAHPLTKDLSVDDPRTTALRREIILEKVFLKSIYQEWYERIFKTLPQDGTILEIGSGAGFFGQMSSRIVTSEIFPTPGVDLVLDGRNLPFSDGELAAITMTDVLHHMPNVDVFFKEAARCIRPGGCITMIEPWNTPWAKWVYRNLHPEPFEPTAGWDIPQTGPLSGANGALPWIIFKRDRAHFEKEFPMLDIQEIRPLMPLSYLLSGGVSMRSLLPGITFPILRRIEKIIGEERFGMFALIVLTRR